MIEGSTAEEPASVRAYRALEQAIVTLELAPGSSSSEAALIEIAGLGRTPVREAMQRLAWEGLIEVRPRAGILIAPMHPGDWGRVIDARKGLEALIAVAAAHDRSIRRKGAIRAAHEAMLDAARASDVMGFLKADKLLDEAVAASVDNIFAVRAAAPLQSHARRFWFRYHQKVDLVASARAHAVMVEAILENDADAAGRAATTLMTMLATLAARAAMA